jgi:hypothetical protein
MDLENEHTLDAFASVLNREETTIWRRNRDKTGSVGIYNRRQAIFILFNSMSRRNQYMCFPSCKVRMLLDKLRRKVKRVQHTIFGKTPKRVIDDIAF